MATASTSGPPPVTATTDRRFLGFWGNPAKWYTLGCTNPGEYYQEASTYFGCSTIYTGCTNGAASTSQSGMQYCLGASTCMTQTLHSTFPAPSFDPTQLVKPMCVTKGYNVIDMYRVSPTPIPSTSSLGPSMTPTSRPSASLPASQTSSIPASSQTAAPSPGPQPVNPGIIAGASIAGIALLLVLAFLIWFFGFHRRKQKREQRGNMAYAQNPAWAQQQPEYVQTSYEVEGSDARGKMGGYAPVRQHPPVETWKYGHASEVSELATESYGRR